jgi:hypothetical protein
MRLITLLVIVFSMTTPALADEIVEQAASTLEGKSEESESSRIRTGRGEVHLICLEQFVNPMAVAACEVFVHKMRENDIEYEVYALGVFEKEHRERIRILESSNEYLRSEVFVLKSQMEVLIDRVSELEAQNKKEE